MHTERGEKPKSGGRRLALLDQVDSNGREMEIYIKHRRINMYQMHNP